MIVHFSAHISKWELVCKFGVIYHIFIISCLCSRFHVWNRWLVCSVITLSYTKCFVHPYTVDVVFTLSYCTNHHSPAPRHMRWNHSWETRFVILHRHYRGSKWHGDHYDDVIMGVVASQITSLTIVYSNVYSGADQSKHQSSASLAFVWEFTGTGEFPAQMASNAENVSIWWRHHVQGGSWHCRFDIHPRAFAIWEGANCHAINVIL